ncbi:MAG: bioC [Rickettsiaceae bacterium]|jgi:malonyl-CoA O-methyltransferase|nr:bioC [Rickettsiaceae bacterium]
MSSIIKQAIIRDFNRAAENYDQHAALQRIVADNLFSIIKPEIKDSDLVLDGGCGTGYFHELLRKNKIYCLLIQSDIAHNMSLKAAEYASPPQYGGTYTITADLENLPIASNSINKFFSSLTLQWVNDLKASFAEVYRTLKPEGKIAFSTIGKGSMIELDESFLSIDNIKRINQNFLNEQEIEHLLKTAGFKDIKIKCETVTQFFESALDIMRSIKGVGAKYKSSNGKFPGKDYFANLEQTYRDKYGNDSGLPISWNIIYAVASK